MSLKFFVLLTAVLAPATAAFAQLSAELRPSIKYAVTAGVGIRSESLTEATLTGSYYLDPNTVLNITLGSLDGEVHEKSGKDSSGNQYYYTNFLTKITGHTLAASYKRFLDNSFYVEGGLDSAQVHGEYQVKATYFGTSDDLTYDVGDYTKLTAFGVIGNQWQWQSFTLGTSWAGLLVPIAHSQSFKDEDALPGSAKTFRDGASNVQFTALRFYLGWAF